jgi:O-antigen/teichoic acid export membrane protein
MGIIAKQGITNSFAILIGFILGGINTVFIFPYVFRDNLEDLGLIQLLVTISFVVAQLLTFGSVGITIRYYPRMVSEKRVGELMFYIWVLPSLAIMLFGLFLLFAGEHFLALFINQNISLSNNTALIILYTLTIGITYSRILAGYSVSLKKTFITSFLNEIIIRIFILVFTALYFWRIISFEDFGIGNAFAYFFPVIVLLIYLRKTQIFELVKPAKKDLQELLVYGFFTWMDLIATWVINRIDTMMIGAILFLSDIPVYNFAFYMSLVVALPNRSMILISAPVIAESFHKKDMKNIQDIYSKSSIVQLLIGGIIFIIIWLNIDAILTFEPKSFYEAKWVFFYLGLSKVIDIFFSVNGTILVSSPFYKFNLYFNLILLALAIIVNIILIPLYGIVGAALATAISLVIFNIMKAVFLYFNYSLQPFHQNTFKGLIILGVAWTAGYFFPAIDKAWLDILVRSAVTAMVFLPLILVFNISEDLNAMFYKFLKKLRK